MEKNMKIQTPYVIITDIGSTTTKAILLNNREKIPKLAGMYHSPTTVEKPVSDVRFGVYHAIEGLERQSGIQLMARDSQAPVLTLSADVTYLTTSSAGGGLQILVIGLTLFDSASSARRAAYGAGGVILDTFAVDDTRQAMQQMLAMRDLRPDMILLCGGTDGGAVSGVLRLAEIIRIAAPEPKFDTTGKIPVIYAGNREAAPLIEKLISNDFDLHILPNLRPEMRNENLQPTQDMIQQLFMENVMEHAPGYAHLLPVVASSIIPTPMGVQKALSIAAIKESLNLFAFDIGGATTDVFSCVNTHFHRTVSANLGMSFSALNVLKESGIEALLRWLPNDIDEDFLRNYIANKSLDPTDNPRSESDYRIEHAIAREALSMALHQHRQMHYNTVKVGFLDKLSRADRDKFEMVFEYAREEEKYFFAPSDVDVLIGAGGIFAHAANHRQSAIVLIDAIQPKGITEIWIDRHFITPHIGILSTLEQKSAEHLLASDCIERIALHVAPPFSARHKKTVLHVNIENEGKSRQMQIMPNEFHYIGGGTKIIKLEALHGASLGGGLKSKVFNTALPVIIDTRIEPHGHMIRVEQEMDLYPAQHYDASLSRREPVIPDLIAGEWIRRIKLPYRGEINVNVGNMVEPDEIVALNRYNPPRLYILDNLLTYKLDPEVVARSLQVKVGDLLDFSDVYARIPDDIRLPLHPGHARKQMSTVRGKVEFVNDHSGIVVLSEIQDYAGKPVTLDLSERLGVPPKLAARYLIKEIGDFVYRNELIAKRMEPFRGISRPALVLAPITGTITELDRKTGRVTIAYLHKPMEFKAHVRGKVIEVIPEQELSIRYSGKRMEGKIGFGNACHGLITPIEDQNDVVAGDLKDRIALLAFAPSVEQLKVIASSSATGIICYMLQARHMVDFLGFEPGIINTGYESIPLTLLIMGGFGQKPMPVNLMNTLRSGGNCFIDPRTRIRAGVLRPFIDLF